MINVCDNCGKYRADKIINAVDSTATCPECGHAAPFTLLPLFMVSGASGAGKSTLCNYLTGKLRGVVILDADILWQEEFNTPDDNYRKFSETWLRLAKDISQSGRPVVLFGAGLGMPQNIEPCVERRYFSQVYYLALVCANDLLEKRLQSRPEWRGSGNSAFIKSQLDFNSWFKSYNGEPKIDLIDTGNKTIEEAANEAARWVAVYRTEQIPARSV
jgi:hypothetical protein